MKKLTILLLILLTILSNLNAQYQVAYTQAKAQEKKGLYYKAIQSYNAAAISRDKPATSDIDKRINFCASKLNGLRIEAEKQKQEIENQQKELKLALKTAEAEKIKAQKAQIKSDSLLTVAKKALTRADEMQRKAEIATFDNAVKERHKEWTGYANFKYRSNRIKILETIDSLDLSNSALPSIPQEVTECTRLKHLNLFGNKDIDWKASDKTLSKLSSKTTIDVSVYNLDSINSKYHPHITRVEILQKGLNAVPVNILKQKQLKTLLLNSCQINSLNSEIGNLTNLTILYLRNNQFSEEEKEKLKKQLPNCTIYF